jgi:hypothetical protein
MDGWDNMVQKIIVPSKSKRRKQKWKKKKGKGRDGGRAYG